jgi:guanylate kinase
MTVTGTRRGRLLVLSAPSGAGKTTLVRELLRREPRLRFSVSYTTRPRRPNEKDGVDYHFVGESEFQDLVERGAFLEFARVFDHWYGTGRKEVEDLLRRGFSVVLEIDWQGAQQVRKRAPEALGVFILPPSLGELARRLRGRGSDSEAVVERRLRDAVGDIEHWREFDYTVFNDDVCAAAAALADIIAGRGAAYRSESPSVRARAEAVLGPAS